MTRVGIVYGSRHGATRGIAERIGEVLEEEGFETLVMDATHVDERSAELAEADAYIVGSGVYMGSWLHEPLEYLKANVTLLATRPVWLFSSGPLPDAAIERPAPSDPLLTALGPAEGPGSGGHKRVAELSARIQPRAHRVFDGAYDPSDPPRAMSERLVRMMPVAKGLPAGDFRDWPAIDAWAREIAAILEPRLVSV